MKLQNLEAALRKKARFDLPCDDMQMRTGARTDTQLPDVVNKNARELSRSLSLSISFSALCFVTLRSYL